MDDDLWDRVFRINVTALVRLTRAVVPLMLDVGTGSVVKVASEAGLGVLTTDVSDCRRGLVT